MYDRVRGAAIGRLRDLTTGEPPHPAIELLRRRLNGDRYAEELGEPFTTAGFCLYRDGSDSVVRHGDTIGRSQTEDTMVAILSLGATRVLALRRAAAGLHCGCRRTTATCW